MSPTMSVGKIPAACRPFRHRSPVRVRPPPAPGDTPDRSDSPPLTTKTIFFIWAASGPGLPAGIPELQKRAIPVHRLWPLMISRKLCSRHSLRWHYPIRFKGYLTSASIGAPCSTRCLYPECPAKSSRFPHPRRGLQVRPPRLPARVPRFLRANSEPFFPYTVWNGMGD